MQFLQLIESLVNSHEQNEIEILRRRNQERAGIIPSNLINRYAFLITIDSDRIKQILLEYEQFKKFQNSTNLYYKHPENPSIPVKGHYHVVDSKGRQEIYSVNFDGSAHHKKNRGYKVPDREAVELKRLGVQFSDDNVLLEYLQFVDSGSFHNPAFVFWFIVDAE